jgi:hypothetical protein
LDIDRTKPFIADDEKWLDLVLTAESPVHKVVDNDECPTRILNE